MSPSDTPILNSSEFKALGSTKTDYSFNAPNYALLERFKSPLEQANGYDSHVSIKCPEFTSLCPKTGQPDFATINIDYAPRAWCVESKSLKLYLMGYRNHGSFHEDCIQQIATHLVQLLIPKWIQVQGQFTARGGIPFWPTVNWNYPR